MKHSQNGFGVEGYGDFELVIGVPEDYDGHRCAYAREYIGEKLGEGLVEALVIQFTQPLDRPYDGEDEREYYRFGGNVRTERLENDD